MTHTHPTPDAMALSVDFTFNLKSSLYCTILNTLRQAGEQVACVCVCVLLLYLCRGFCIWPDLLALYVGDLQDRKQQLKCILDVVCAVGAL